MSTKAKEKYLLLILISITTVFIMSLCFNDSIWYDESFSIAAIKGSYSNMFKNYLNIDVHPPLYYIMLKIYASIFGTSAIYLKIFSLIPVLLTAIIGITLIKDRFGFNTSILFIILLMFMPCILDKSIEIRMYTWSMLFVTLSGVYAYEIIENSSLKNWMIFLISSLLAAYTHYYALVSVAFIYVFLFFVIFIINKNQIKSWFICSVFTVIGYFPWLIIFIQQSKKVKNNYWIKDESILDYIRNVINEIFYLHSSIVTLIIVFIFFMSILVCIKNLTKKLEKKYIFALLCLGIFIMTFVSGIVISKLVRPIFIVRYLIPSTGLLWLFFAVSLSEVNKKILLSICTFILVFGIFNFKEVYLRELNYKNQIENTKLFFENNISEDDLLISNLDYFNWWEHIQLSYYLNNDVLSDIKDIEKYKNKTIWILCDPNDEDYIKKIKLEGYEVNKENSLKMDYYKFDVYSIK